jgi:hypothetical protein
MLRNTAFASLAVLGAFAAMPATVRAQAPMSGAVAPAQVGSTVGGGGVTLSGGGVDRTITYSSSGAGAGASYAQPGRIATFAGNSGGNPSWTYAAPASGSTGREAWMLGGGDDAQVVYIDPMAARRR